MWKFLRFPFLAVYSIIAVILVTPIAWWRFLRHLTHDEP